MFKKILKDAVEGLPGAVGAIFVDGEGESVEHFFAGADYDIKLLGAHQGILLNLLATAAEGSGHGRVQGMVVSTDEARVIVQPLKDGYLLVLLLSLHCNTGVAMHAVKKTAQALVEEI